MRLGMLLERMVVVRVLAQVVPVVVPRVLRTVLLVLIMVDRDPTGSTGIHRAILACHCIQQVSIDELNSKRHKRRTVRNNGHGHGLRLVPRPLEPCMASLSLA